MPILTWLLGLNVLVFGDKAALLYVMLAGHAGRCNLPFRLWIAAT